MVGPAAKREAVAHLQTVMGLSERRPVPLPAPIERWCATGPFVRRMGNYAAGFAILPMIAAASAIGGCLCCCGERVSDPGSTASIVSTARKG